MRFLSIYGSSIVMYMKARMEYRTSFFVIIFGNISQWIVAFVTLWVFIENFNMIGGWTFDDLLLLMGLRMLTAYIAATLFFRSVFQIHQEITSGNLDGFLTRPMGLMKYLVCRYFCGELFIGQLVLAIGIMIYIIAKNSIQFTVFTYVYLILAVLGGILLNAGAMIFFGSLGFWMLHSEELGVIVYYNMLELIKYPLVIFPVIVRYILTFILPWAFMSYYPCLIILGKAQTTGDYVLGYISPLVGVLVFMLSICMFELGMRRYSGTGS